MVRDWASHECKKADKSKGVVILEDPEKKYYLDDLLINRFWPIIRLKLKNTNYIYEPEKNPETTLELGYELTRSLTFMLFDEGGVFFKGKLGCSISGWMLESNLFLGLSRENNPQMIFEILGNSRFRGLPPKLEIDKDGQEYFQITFHNGEGAGWAVYDDKKIDERINKIIDVNVQLYEYPKDGYIPEKKIGDFLALAYEVYEAY